jgi:hypothetical protein
MNNHPTKPSKKNYRTINVEKEITFFNNSVKLTHKEEKKEAHIRMIESKNNPVSTIIRRKTI